MTPEKIKWLKENAQIHPIGTIILRECLGEIEHLKRIIAKELVENDGLGSEFVYVMTLKEEIAEVANKLDLVQRENDILQEELMHLRNKYEGFQ